MEIQQNDDFGKPRNLGLVLTSVLELLVLTFLIIIECILRTSDAFPVRRVPFSRDDDVIGYTTEAGGDAMRTFVYNAEVSYTMVVVLSFCVPPVLMLICELIRWKLADNHVLHVATLCVACELHTVLRRLIRFTGTFLTGLLTTMVFTDVIKFMVGRPRPVFLDVCRANASLCSELTTDGQILCSVDTCLQSDQSLLRWSRSRLSFPSFHAAITAYAACFMAIYMQTMVCERLKCRVFGPFLSLTAFMAALLCSLSRYSLYYSHWTDVVVGFFLGSVIAFYVSVFVLDDFEERRDVIRNRLMKNLDRVWETEPSKRQPTKSSNQSYWPTSQWNLRDNMEHGSDRLDNTKNTDVISLSSVGMTSRDRQIAESTYAYY